MENKKYQRMNNFLLQIYKRINDKKKERENAAHTNTIEMRDDVTDNEKKFWFEINLHEMTSLNPMIIKPNLPPQLILIEAIKGDDISQKIAKKFQSELHDHPRNQHHPIPILRFEDYVASFLDRRIWHRESDLIVTASLMTYAVLTVRDMKLIIKTLPIPSVWYHSDNMANANEFVDIINNKLSISYREMVDFCPYLREDTKSHHMKKDCVYRLDVKTPIKYVENFQDCN